MDRLYNRIAGQSLERIAALSDGVFAVAMTLIVLDIHVPEATAIQSERGLWDAVVALAPHIVTWLMSFMTLGIFWVGQQTQLNQFARADRNLAWIHMGFMAAVAVLPFSTSLLANFIAFRVALLLYWANVLVLGLVLFASWRYAVRTALVRDDAPAEITKAITERIVGAQVLYAVGAALCVFGTYWSIGIILLVQLNYVLAPRLWLGKRG